jgi:hypothetical protein
VQRGDAKFMFGVGVVLLSVGFLLTWLFRGDPRQHAQERLERERAQERAAVLEFARRDLDCQDVVVDISPTISASGCGRQARYTWDGKEYRRAPETDATPATECESAWTRDAPAVKAPPTTARDIAVAITSRGNEGVVSFPLEAFTKVKGLAKFRYRDPIEVRFDGAKPIGEEVTVPCLDPEADGNVQTDATCTLPWSEAVEVAECRRL